MWATFFFEREAVKKHKFLKFLKGLYFLVGGPINMNIGAFSETSVGFLKSVILQLFSKYSQSSVNLNVKSRTKSSKSGHVVLVFSISM